MSKEVTQTGEMWVEKTNTGNMKLGFTQSFLDRYQHECWHIIPHQGKLQKGMVLLSLETNDGLVPVKSPYDGDIVSFATEAINFPEKLTDTKEIVVIKIQDQRPLSAKDYRRPPGKKVQPRVDTRGNQINDQWQGTWFGPMPPNLDDIRNRMEAREEAQRRWLNERGMTVRTVRIENPPRNQGEDDGSW